MDSVLEFGGDVVVGAACVDDGGDSAAVIGDKDVGLKLEMYWAGGGIVVDGVVGFVIGREDSVVGLLEGGEGELARMTSSSGRKIKAEAMVGSATNQKNARY